MGSIYDELYRRRVSRRQPTVAEGRRHDLSAERVCLVDGIAINAAGTLLMGAGLPEAPLASPCPLLTDAQGFPRLAKPISTIALSERHLGIDGRLSAIWDFLAGSLEVLVRQLPDDEKVDLVLTLPASISGWLQQSLQQSIVDQLSKHHVWQEGQSLCRVDHGQNINALLAPSETAGGMRWVFWCSLDSLLDESQLRQWDELSSKRSPLIAGEGGALMLFERTAAETLPSKGQFWVRAMDKTHQPIKGARSAALKTLMAALITSDEPTLGDIMPSGETPAWCIMDMGNGERAGDAFMALFDRWQSAYEPLVNCFALDHFCGWVGQATPSTMLMMAAASMAEQDAAMLLSLCQPEVTTMTLLTPVKRHPQV